MLIQSSDMLDNRKSIVPIVELIEALQYKRYRKGDGIRPSVLKTLPSVLQSYGMTQESSVRIARTLQA